MEGGLYSHPTVKRVMGGETQPNSETGKGGGKRPLCAEVSPKCAHREACYGMTNSETGVHREVYQEGTYPGMVLGYTTWVCLPGCIIGCTSPGYASLCV